MDLQFVQLSLGGRSHPSTHPEDFLSAQVRKGNLAQMWLQTEEKLQGSEVGSGPSFAWPRDLLLPGICLDFSSSALSLIISCKLQSRESSYCPSQTMLLSSSQRRVILTQYVSFTLNKVECGSMWTIFRLLMLRTTTVRELYSICLFVLLMDQRPNTNNTMTHTESLQCRLSWCSAIKHQWWFWS